MRKHFSCWALLLLATCCAPAPAAAAPSPCAPYLAAAENAPGNAGEALLVTANRQCPRWAAGRRALAGRYLAAAATEKNPNRAQALLYRAMGLLARAVTLSPRDKELAGLYARVSTREAQLRATAGAAPFTARQIAVLLAPARGSLPAKVAPAAAPRIDFPNVRFSAGTARLEPSSADQLNELGRALRFLVPRLKVLLAGHTDRYGDREANLLLSRLRALEVKKYLMERWQIEPERLESTGLGYAAPLPGLSPFDPTNRRVEVRALP